jgi:hypothetical protein
MAHLQSNEIVRCICSPSCSTKARIKHWDCGCMEVDIINDSNACSDCTDFSGMESHCGESGYPRETSGRRHEARRPKTRMLGAVSAARWACTAASAQTDLEWSGKANTRSRSDPPPGRARAERRNRDNNADRSNQIQRLVALRSACIGQDDRQHRRPA